MNEKKPWHYNQQSLIRALREAGLRERDIVFSHISLGRLGYPEEGSDIETACEVLYRGFMEVLGSEGTLLIPTYTYSIGRREVYDVQNTPSTVGPFTEYFRKLPGVIRSRDPMLAVAGIGPLSAELLMELPHTCYGLGSIYDRMRKVGARICNVGISLYWATFRHHIEEMAGVPFRFKKLFAGYIRDRGITGHESWIYFAAPFATNCNPDGMKLDKKARSLGICRCVPLGRSEIICIDAQEYFQLGLEELSRDPWFTAQGPPCDIDEIVELENERVGGRVHRVSLHNDASMRDFIESTWSLPRDVVSDGIDAAFEAIESQVPLVIHRFYTGTEFLGQVVPEKWTCLDGYVETLAGKRILSYTDSYLHVASYSQPFNGTVMRDELLQHLATHPFSREAIPYRSLWDRRDWGLSCDEKTKESFFDELYRVVIRSEFSFSTLKVGEVVARGESDECVVFCAYLDHSAQANEGLSGVAVGMDLIRGVLRSGDNHYTYMLLIVPDDIGLVAYLERRKELVPLIKTLVFLDVLAVRYPHLFQYKADMDSRFVRQCMSILHSIKMRDDHVSAVSDDKAKYGRCWSNKFNWGIPMLSIHRQAVDGNLSPEYLFPEHHSNLDSLELFDYNRLDESRDLMLELVRRLEGGC